MGKWGDAGVYLEMWTCGDDVCDCTQPEIYRYTPGQPPKYEMLWEGTFHSQADSDEFEKQKQEGLEAAKIFKPDFINENFWPAPSPTEEPAREERGEDGTCKDRV